jgi:GntR family transcriptional regulator, sialic acid-inducible nan operon repressor
MTLATGEDLIAYQAHQAIFRAVAERNPDRAEKAMKGHLDHVARRYGEILGESDERLRRFR